MRRNRGDEVIFSLHQVVISSCKDGQIFPAGLLGTVDQVVPALTSIGRDSINRVVKVLTRGETHTGDKIIRGIRWESVCIFKHVNQWVCLDDGGGAAGVLLSCIMKCALDLRFPCMQSIIVCGGGACIPGKQIIWMYYAFFTLEL